MMNGSGGTVAPRTYAPKPRYAVKFWRERGLRPPAVDVLSIIAHRERRAYGGSLPPVRFRVRQADSRTVNWSELVDELGPIEWIVTSPPYYGLRTYRPDQWLREWFVGGDDEVCYSAQTQVTHGSPEKFAADLRLVWEQLARHCSPDARLVVRFGAINDRPVFSVALRRCSY
jgi:hypothetical protein